MEEKSSDDSIQPNIEVVTEVKDSVRTEKPVSQAKDKYKNWQSVPLKMMGAGLLDKNDDDKDAMK